MSEENISDGYEVGYGKPPKDTRFQKGISGNPKGRPRKTLDFDHELLRQSRATVTINVNGSRRRVSKHKAAILQMLNQAISGNVPALRTYFDRHQIASEKAALREASQPRDPRKCDDVKEFTDQELMQMIADLQKEKETTKGHISSAN